MFRVFTPRDEQMCSAIVIDLGCLEKQEPTQMKKNYYYFVSDNGMS